MLGTKLSHPLLGAQHTPSGARSSGTHLPCLQDSQGWDLTASPGASPARIRSLDGRLIPFIPASLTPTPPSALASVGETSGTPTQGKEPHRSLCPQTPGFQPQSVSSKSLGPDLSPCLLLEPWGPPWGHGRVQAQKPTQSGVPTTSQGLKQRLKQTSLTRPRSPSSCHRVQPPGAWAQAGVARGQFQRGKQGAWS